jgi:predicted N-acetyltransferase YhbS
MTQPPLIRRADIEDSGQISALVTQAYEPYIARIGQKPAPMLDDYRKVVAENDVFVATLGTEIVGVLVMAQDATELLLMNVAVAPKFKGQGIGKTLMVFCEEHARSMGSQAVRLYTHELMIENIEIYKKGDAQGDREWLCSGVHDQAFGGALVRRKIREGVQVCSSL